MELPTLPLVVFINYNHCRNVESRRLSEVKKCVLVTVYLCSLILEFSLIAVYSGQRVNRFSFLDSPQCVFEILNLHLNLQVNLL